MARMIKCPRCQSQIDVTNVAGGSTVPCADCGVMLRVPTGQTGVRPRVPTPAPQPAVEEAAGKGTRVRERQTPLFKKMSGVRSPAERKGPSRGAGERPVVRRKSSGPAVAIVAAVLAIGLIGLLVVAMASKQKQQSDSEKAREERAEAKKKKYADDVAAAKKQEAEWQAEADRAAAEAAKKGDKPAAGQLGKKASGEYDIPATFEPGGRKLAEKLNKAPVQEIKVDAALLKEYEGLASSGRVDDIVKDDSKFMACVIASLINDDEKICRTSFQALSAICVKHKISSKEDRFENPVKPDFVNSSYYRGGDYNFWSDWWNKGQNQTAVKQWATGAETVGEIPEMVKWDELVRDLRAGGYEDPNHPGGRAVARIKLMGKGAYPHLIKHIDHEEIMIGKAIVTVLNDLTKQTRPLPTEATKTQMKAEWETWLKKNQ
jgi:hypothetical protein